MKDLEYFCGCDTPEQVNSISFAQENVLFVVDEINNPQSSECDLNWGTNSNIHFKYWCALNVSAILYIQGSKYPGLLGNGHYGPSKFSNIGVEDCVFLETRMENANDTLFASLIENNSLVVDLSTNENHALKLFSSFEVTILFRVVFPASYFCVCLASLKILWVRLMYSKLNSHQRNILLVNIFKSSVLGTLESLGNKHIGDILPYSVVLMFYAQLFGCGLAGDIWMGSMYFSAIKTLEKGRYVDHRSRTPTFLCGLLIGGDFMVGVSLVLAPWKTRAVVQIFMSVLSAILQIGVGCFVVSNRINFQRCLAKANKEYLEMKVVVLEQRLRWLIRLSVSCSTMFLLLFVYTNIFGIPWHQPSEWLLYWFFANVLSLVASFAQVYSCAPIQNSNKVDVMRVKTDSRTESKY